MPTIPPGARRALLAGLPQLAAVAPAVVLLATAADRLPDPIARHFDVAGTADGFSGRWAVLAFDLVLGLGMALLFGLIARQQPGSPAISRRDLARWFIGLSWATAGFIGVILTGTVAANLDLPDAAAAALPWWTVPLGLLAGATAGAAGTAVAPRTAHAPTVDPEAVRAMPLGPTEQVSWSRPVGSPWLLAIGAGMVAAGIVVALLVEWAPGLAFGGGGALVLLLGSARVTVDRRGLTVAFGALGWPRLRIPASDMASATVVDVSPSQFGGWGYRIVPGGTGVIIRSGPALMVVRRSGRRFTVTTDDPATAAGLLNGMVSRNG